MTTLIPFTPSNTSNPPFSTTLTLDGASYIGNVTWNVYGQRWYMTIMDTNSNVVWSGAMIGSPDGGDIFLAPGIFSASTILYREDSGNIEVNP
ncbi:hypothetical protein [Burkholderia sp. BCC0405]|uniref:phage baseplate plug family protein n=1 Tax=Burkholderia sp. BCC0405 TaxID=2676298 RepID=UPI001588711D|nr:hypothetical protein [Burkholderia sp. BCC0405]